MGRNPDNSANFADFEKALIGNGIHDLIVKGLHNDKRVENENPTINTKQIGLQPQGSKRLLKQSSQESLA